MENQYLIVAESILYKNNKLTCINMYDQFMAVTLPAEFVFDLAVMCGPGWPVGEYDIAISMKSNATQESNELGTLKVAIPHENFTYNSIANNLNVKIGESISDVTFVVHRNGEEIIERTYPINSLLSPAPVKTEEPAQQV